MNIDVMSSLNRRRDDVAKTQNASAELFLFNRKAQIKKEIQILLRDKIVNMIESSLQLSLFALRRRVAVDVDCEKNDECKI